MGDWNHWASILSFHAALLRPGAGLKGKSRVRAGVSPAAAREPEGPDPEGGGSQATARVDHAPRRTGREALEKL